MPQTQPVQIDNEVVQKVEHYLKSIGVSGTERFFEIAALEKINQLKEMQADCIELTNAITNYNQKIFQNPTHE